MEISGQFGLIWEQTRAPLLVPVLKVMVVMCLAMSLMLFIERVYMGIVIAFVKLLRRKPEKMYKWEPMKDDVELGYSGYPMVLVQIPMYNEKEVYQLSIGAACGLSWPADRIIIQVLDDSTDPAIKLECQRWASKGVNVKYEIRDNRNGYKAGALKEGMKHSYVKQCDYVAIFDADFQPEPDFLNRSIPFLVNNPELGLVQARWKFVNSDECLMTRMQEMSLDYHFIVEQEVGSSTYAFFGFNGTAGVWRISAINEAGGWKDRTTVEDMDLSVRASLKGWKFVYAGDLKVKNELPSTFKAYRFQQHRWSCGPANLFKKMVTEIMRNKRVSLWKKLYVIYSFFFVRKIVAHIVTFVFYCVVLPATVFFPEIEVPKWGAVYIPSIITLLNAVGTPRSLHLVLFWILFENVMSLHRTKATFIGLLEAGRVNEWVVTEKLGDALKPKSDGKPPRKPRIRIGERVHLLELGIGAYLFLCGCYDLAFGKNGYFIFLFLQSIAFFLAAAGYVGTIVLLQRVAILVYKPSQVDFNDKVRTALAKNPGKKREDIVVCSLSPSRGCLVGLSSDSDSYYENSILSECSDGGQSNFGDYDIIPCLSTKPGFYVKYTDSDCAITNLLHGFRSKSEADDFRFNSRWICSCIMSHRIALDVPSTITFQFKEKLGQGGYGTVYKGTLSNDVSVAVKVLNNFKGNGEEFINKSVQSEFRRVELIGYRLLLSWNLRRIFKLRTEASSVLSAGTMKVSVI
ncbi:putative mannan synthase 9 [Hibiscus syriacus]|uniref:glucomannan 4-beta-mannosyltransferase n=1 Tax=Hibiscus syriacus TaxID=106335 RepID=A0A6A3AAR8_HIBSY|nr:putative mannan synthase 9 [Hibiscus syriacus]